MSNYPLRKKLLTVTATVVTAGGLGLAGWSTASAATGGPITGIAGKCLDVTGGGSANGTRIQLWSCTGGTAQQWSVAADGSIAALGKCLDVAGASTADGARVQIYDCNGSAAQRWTSSSGRLVNAGSGKCLDATGQGSANGTLLQIWSCGTGANQKWTIGQPVVGGPCQPGATYGNPLPGNPLPGTTVAGTTVAGTTVAGTTVAGTTVAATKIKDGFNFLEGPAWDATTQTLKLTSMYDGAGAQNVQPSDILTFTPSTATFSTFVANAGSNGLAISRDGTSIIAATHDQRSVSSYDLATKARGVVAANYQGHEFNSPNDVTVGPDGTVYFTDPDFQRADRADGMGGRTDVFRAKNGVVTLIDDTIREPNGIELSPDGTWLYVGGNATGKIYRYPVNADGSTGVRSDFASLAGTDGGTIDCAGNVYQITFSDGKVHVFSPSGQALGTITAGVNATNAAFGGPDGKTLYLTSGTPSGGDNTGNYGLYSVRLNVPGWPY